MRTTLIAAIAAGGCVLAFQTAALAQAVSAYPQSWTGSAEQSTGKAQRRTAAGYFDQYSGNSNRPQASAHCDGNYDPYNDTCYSADIHTPSHE
ncbi:MAG TPA: hypothetical protein VGH13_25275 [Xanthobacteraceae bacterium]|jgi:hypothetical protein